MPLKMKDSEIMQCVQVKVEIGHRASPRAKPTKDGFTHDWTVYVRAPEGSNLAHFVEKVEFHLHDTFADPLRVVKEPPYHVSEVGYADFGLLIEIYFKNKGEPQKIKFNYNLFLQTHEPVNYVQCEKLTFINPTDEFKRKLIKAGGVHVLPPGKAQFADLCGPPLKKQKQHATITSKVHVLSPEEAQFADLFGPPIKVEKQKQPSTISSKVLVLPPGEAQFADLFGSPINFEKQKKPSTISSKDKVSKQILNFSGDEKSSSSGKHINASLKSTAKEVKIENSSKGHDAASTSSSSSFSSISKEKVQKTKSSREKHSSKESNNSSKMVPNPSPLPSQKRPSDSPIPSEHNQTKAGRSSSASLEKFRNEDKQRSEGKAIKDQLVKHNSSQNRDISQSKSKDGKDSHKTDTRKQTSSKSSKELKKESKLKDDKALKFDDKKEAKDDKEENNDKKELQDDKRELNKDVKDDRKEVKDHTKVKYEKQEVKDGKKEVENHKKEVKNDRKGVKEVKYNNREDILMDNKSIKEVKDDKMEVKAKKSSGSSESRNENDKHKVMIELNTDEEEKSSKCKHSSSKSSSKGENDKEKSSNPNMKSEIKTDAKKQRKRSGSLLSALDRSIVKKQRYSVKHLSKVTPIELKEDFPLPIDISSGSDDDFFREITGSDSGVDFDISPNCGIIKTINQNYSISSLKKLMDELEDNSTDDDDIIDTVDVFSRPSSAKHSPLVESVKESESSEDISSESEDDFFWEITGSDSDADLAISPTCSISKTSNQIYSRNALKQLMDELEDNSADDITHIFSQPKSSKVTLMELKDDLYLSSDSSSESDDDFFLEIESDMDLALSLTSNISNTSNQIYSKSALKNLMDELEDSSADDEDDRKSEITTDKKKSKSEQRKRSGSALFGSMAKRQRVIV